MQRLVLPPPALSPVPAPFLRWEATTVGVGEGHWRSTDLARELRRVPGDLTPVRLGLAWPPRPWYSTTAATVRGGIKCAATTCCRPKNKQRKSPWRLEKTEGEAPGLGLLQCLAPKHCTASDNLHLSFSSIWEEREGVLYETIEREGGREVRLFQSLNLQLCAHTILPSCIYIRLLSPALHTPPPILSLSVFIHAAVCYCCPLASIIRRPPGAEM